MKYISLTQNKFAIVDDEDFEWLTQWKWYAQKSMNTYYVYAHPPCIDGKQLAILMHREIMKAPKGIDVDHRNHNGLDNQRHNLRVCTRSQNQQNRQITCGISKYKGVCWHKGRKTWVAYIITNKKQLHLGCYDSEIEAARAYDKAALELFKDFAYTNLHGCNYDRILHAILRMGC